MRQKTINPSVSKVTKQKYNSYDSISTREYRYRNLSNEFDIKVSFKRFNNVDEDHDSSIVRLTLLDKNNKTVLDTVSVTSIFYFRNLFQDSTNVLSHVTKVNTNKQVVDNYFGDIVVVDLNFDNKDDIVVINDSGGNDGPLYSYFIQNNKRKFILDNFLTDSMMYFPSKISKNAQTLVTYVHAGACCVGEQVYHFNKSKDKWILKSHKILGLEK